MADELKINPLRKYLRKEKLPHFFCAGCGCGQVLNYYIQALDELQMDPEQMLHIGGVGCTARIPIYIKTDMFHGVHGRTLAWATGVKMMRPELPVVIFAGDGDLASIGGNHMIQSCRRNLDVTVVMVNNMNFAMTGGQVAPTTPDHDHALWQRRTPVRCMQARGCRRCHACGTVDHSAAPSMQKGHGTSLAAQGIFAD